MYLMQTVSTVPRARPLQAQPAAPAPRSRSVDRGPDGMLLFPGSPLPAAVAVAAAASAPGSPPPPAPAQRRRASGEAAVAAAAAGVPDADGDKKKKWSLGGLFRRRRKPAAAAPEESDSSSADEAPRKGFLSRRRSRRDKRKPRPKLVGTFDHVVVNPLSQSPLRPRRDADPPVPPPPLLLPPPPPPPLAASPPSSPPQSHPGVGARRRDSSQSRCSSAGSGSLDGTGRRTGRRGQAMARAEALRDQHRADSSSDECGGFCQSPPTLRARLDDSSPSTGRRTRAAARTERHFRRLSRDEEGMAADGGRPRGARSDAEQRGRWAAVYHESCDTDPNLLTRTPSATPSPKQSPLVRQRHFRQYSPAASSAPVDTARTFPPGHGMWPVVRPPPQQGPQPAARAPPTSMPSRPFARGTSPVPAAAPRRPDYAAPPPRPFPSFETVYAKPAAAVPAPGDYPQRSVSYDCDIHRPAPLRAPSTMAGANDVLVVQFPIARLRPAASSPPPPPPRDPQRRLSAAPAAGASNADFPRPMSYAFETGSPQVARVEYCLNQPASVLTSSSLRSLGPPGSVWNAYQRRSCSDNQLTAPSARPRPSSVTPEATRPVANGPVPYTKTPDTTQPAHFQYFADQNPRSRRPIHIQLRGGSNDQPYLSDSQVVMKPPYQKNPLLSATEFWRQRDLQQHQQGQLQPQQQVASAMRQTRKPVLSAAAAAAALAKPPLQSNAAPLQSDRSRSNSPRPADALRPRATKPRPMALVRPADSQSSLSGASDTAPGPSDSLDAVPRPLSMVLENSEAPEPARHKPAPPAPPARRFSRQSSTSSLEASEWTAEDDTRRRHRRSTNLEDALNELEAIYKSLRLGDEDLLERAERREAPAYRPPPPPPDADFPWRAARCGAESDSGFNYGGERARIRRTLGAPDPVTDDMAYRRLHPKERPSSQDARTLLSQSGSYLLASPALAQQAGEAALAPPPPPTPPQLVAEPGVALDEPDVTHDDVLFRSIKHANNTLRIADPQPPFGIPLGPVPPAASSDYLHATPVDRPRSAFKPCKVPDVVKDDLAFRALRKDAQKDPALPPARVDGVDSLFPARLDASNSSNNFSLRKKRAVRSLSANLMGLVHREPLVAPGVVAAATTDDLEKTQSLSNLPDALQVAQKILEGKEVIGGGPVAALRRLADSAAPDALDPHYGVTPSSWVERALLDRSLLGGASTSTETLTDSRANAVGPCGAGGGSRRGSWQPRPSPPPPPALSPAAAAEQTRLDEVLNALAREASATSERLDRELQQLRLDPHAALDANCNVVLAVKPERAPSPAPSPKEPATPSPVPEPTPLRSPEAVASAVAAAVAVAACPPRTSTPSLPVQRTSAPASPAPQRAATPASPAAQRASTPSSPAVPRSSAPASPSTQRSSSPAAPVGQRTSTPASPANQRKSASASPAAAEPSPELTPEKSPSEEPDMETEKAASETEGDGRRHETVDELVSQCRRDLDELLRQVDAATRPPPAAGAATPQGEDEDAPVALRWAAGLEPLTALGLALALLLSLLAMLAI